LDYIVPCHCHTRLEFILVDPVCHRRLHLRAKLTTDSWRTVILDLNDAVETLIVDGIESRLSSSCTVQSPVDIDIQDIRLQIGCKPVCQGEMSEFVGYHDWIANIDLRMQEGWTGWGQEIFPAEAVSEAIYFRSVLVDRSPARVNDQATETSNSKKKFYEGDTFRVFLDLRLPWSTIRCGTERCPFPLC